MKDFEIGIKRQACPSVLFVYFVSCEFVCTLTELGLDGLF